MAPTDDALLGGHQQAGCTLLATDSQSSVLNALNAGERILVAYTAYGARYPQLELPGFNGEHPEPVTGHYLLGNGYRAFNPVLMRFNNPDSLSPFGEGGLNAYTYCAGDPVNRVDPTGHTWAWVKLILRGVGMMRKSQSNLVTLKAVKNIKFDNPLGLRTPGQTAMPFQRARFAKTSPHAPPLGVVNSPAAVPGLVPNRFRSPPPLPSGFSMITQANGQQFVIVPSPQRLAALRAGNVAQQVQRQVAQGQVIRGQRFYRDRFTGAGFIRS